MKMRKNYAITNMLKLIINIRKNYDENLNPTYLIYLDVNALYSWATRAKNYQLAILNGFQKTITRI